MIQEGPASFCGRDSRELNGSEAAEGARLRGGAGGGGKVAPDGAGQGGHLRHRGGGKVRVAQPRRRHCVLRRTHQARQRSQALHQLLHPPLRRNCLDADLITRCAP